MDRVSLNFLLSPEPGTVRTSPSSSPIFGCHYTGDEGYCQHHRLTAEVHTRAGRPNPFQLEIDHAESTSRTRVSGSAQFRRDDTVPYHLAATSF